ncbi:MAG: ABC transporter permease [Nitrospinae bacterium]|nr:ABC transporter permease [Nitrospinota bacterium]
MKQFFSFSRFWAVISKEFIQMRRDRVTFAMMIGIPIMQTILFGFAINSDPKHLPTAVISADNSPFARSIVSAMQNSDYFKLVKNVSTVYEGRELLRYGEAQFLVTIPEDFSKKLVRGETPTVLIEADATDPAATSNALGALSVLSQNAIQQDIKGSLSFLQSGSSPFEFLLHREYNPEGITQYNIVPGLMGVVLTLTMVVITALAMTRERERGTMENLLSTPVKPAEVITGKIIPYIIVGYLQMSVILIAAKLLFEVPMVGNLVLLFMVSLVFILANLSMGITFSTLAKNQLQAMQMAVFFFLPSLLLSGFMFPFRGMPGWAQSLGEILPLTHFLRIIRGILLKGTGFMEILPELGAIILFLTVALSVAIKRYRQTLD